MVEQRTHKPLVVGSNPSAATFFKVDWGIIGLRGNYDDNCIERIVRPGGVGQGKQGDITKGAAHEGRRKA